MLLGIHPGGSGGTGGWGANLTRMPSIFPSPSRGLQGEGRGGDGASAVVLAGCLKTSGREEMKVNNTIETALEGIKDGATIMVGGFGLVGIRKN